MPPRYAYWTILVDNLPTAFRASTREDLQPTFEQLRRKNPTAVMRWFARGILWDSPEHAGRAGREEGEQRGKGWRPGGDHRDPRERFELERKAKNAARRQERFDQKVQRRRPEDGGLARRRAPSGGEPDERPRFEHGEQPGDAAPETNARAGRPLANERDRPQGRPPAQRPFDIAAGRTGRVLGVRARSRVAIVRRVAARGTMVHPGVRVRPQGDHPEGVRSMTAALPIEAGRAVHDHSTAGCPRTVAVPGPATGRAPPRGPREDRDRPQGRPPEGRPFEQNGRPDRPAPRRTDRSTPGIDLRVAGRATIALATSAPRGAWSSAG